MLLKMLLAVLRCTILPLIILLRQGNCEVCPTSCRCENSAVNCSAVNLTQLLNMMNIEPKKVTWTKLILSNNKIGADFPWTDLPGWIEELYIDGNELQKLPCNIVQILPRLRRLDASRNRISEIEPCRNFNAGNGSHVDKAAICRLERLDLHNNHLTSFHHVSARMTRGLKYLSLGENRFVRLDWSSLGVFDQLQFFNVSDNKFLQHIDGLTLEHRMPNLKEFVAMNCVKLANFPAISWPAHIQLRVGGSRAWNCTCDLLWLTKYSVQVLGSNATCYWPAEYRGVDLNHLNHSFLNCHSPKIMLNATKAYYAVGDKARLECSAEGSPAPQIMWITPGNQRILYPYNLTYYPTKEDTERHQFHHDHEWHISKNYDPKLPTASRVIMLRDGTLYIDYVTREDGGSYQCIAYNLLGNTSIQLEFKLNYDVLRAVQRHSLLVGLACAASLLLIGCTVGVTRALVLRCRRSREEDRKRKTVRELLDHIDAYRSEKMQRFRAYRSHKMAGISDKYTGQIQRIKEVCQANLESMQEQYNQRLAKVRENCDNRMELIREKYSNKMGRIKDYRSCRVERLRENYQLQIDKVRSYAASQLERLRDQYHLQQQYILKIMEAMNMENCLLGSQADNLFPSQLDLIVNVTPPDVLPLDISSCAASRRQSVVSDEFLTADEDADEDDECVDADGDDFSDLWESESFATEKAEEVELEELKHAVEVVSQIALNNREDTLDGEAGVALSNHLEEECHPDQQHVYDVHFRLHAVPKIVSEPKTTICTISGV